VLLKDQATLEVSTSTSRHQSVPDLYDHRPATSHRSDGFGVFTTLTSSSVAGNKTLLHPDSPSYTLLPHVEPMWPSYSPHMMAALPQMSFPQFDGHHPKMWMAKCESYFDVFAIPGELWVKVAVMHFVGSVAFWLQSMDKSFAKHNRLNFASGVCPL
jgi:hypothetical protein